MIQIQGPESKTGFSQFDGFWQTISARPGLNISVFDFVTGAPSQDAVSSDPCVSLMFIFAGNGRSWLVDEVGQRHGPVHHRPGRLYFTYAPETIRGVNDVPGGIRSYGVDVRLSIELWQRIVGDSPDFSLTDGHPFHAAACDKAWIGILPVDPDLRHDAREVFDLARAGNSDLIVEARGLELVEKARKTLAQVPQTHPVLARDKQAVLVVKERISEALDRNWRVEELANEAGVSLKRLKSIFPAHTGLPVFEYLQETRLNEAQRLLETQELSVTDVALTVGYSSISHFSALFKRRFGLSPKEFKQRK